MALTKQRTTVNAIVKILNKLQIFMYNIHDNLR